MSSNFIRNWSVRIHWEIKALKENLLKYNFEKLRTPIFEHSRTFWQIILGHVRNFRTISVLRFSRIVVPCLYCVYQHQTSVYSKNCVTTYFDLKILGIQLITKIWKNRRLIFMRTMTTFVYHNIPYNFVIRPIIMAYVYNTWITRFYGLAFLYTYSHVIKCQKKKSSISRVIHIIHNHIIKYKTLIKWWIMSQTLFVYYYGRSYY